MWTKSQLLKSEEKMSDWMLYGATGYTGTISAEEAVRRGHSPLLAGRNEQKLRALAERLGLDYVVAGLDDRAALEKALARVDLVLHEAGPFAFTAEAMRKACLATGTHYLDITGEIGVFERGFAYHEQAREKGIVFMSGVGFDVIPTDCLAKYVADQIPNATELELAFTSLGGVSPGTSKTAVEGVSSGGWVRRDGKLRPYPMGEGARKQRFMHRELWVMPIPWGDLSTAYRTTGIPNITCLQTWPLKRIEQIRRNMPLVKGLFKIKALRRAMQKVIEWRVTGPDEEIRQRVRSYVWARAADAGGNEAQAWLETIEAYQLTVVGALNAVELVLDGQYAGALTPAGAFGADFVMGIEGTTRLDSLPE